MSPVTTGPHEVPSVHRPPRDPFGWSHQPDLGLLRLEGELDLTGVEDLGTALASAEDPARNLVVDLAGLDFIDCAATACLFRLAGRMSRTGRRMVLEGARGQVARLLDLTGLPPGVERLSDGPRLRLVSGPWARTSSVASLKGADVAA